MSWTDQLKLADIRCINVSICYWTARHGGSFAFSSPSSYD
jgi:hypothetical protein